MQKNLCYVSGWARDKIRTEEMYQDWLASLKNGDTVLMQTYHKEKGCDCITDFPQEMWEFSVGRVACNKKTIEVESDFVSIDFEKGWRTYPDGELYSEVFPVRIVPTHSSLTATADRAAFGHKPIYEPLWNTHERLVFLVSPELDVSVSSQLKSLRQIPHAYEVKRIDSGSLWYAFAETEGRIEEWCYRQKIQAKFLYAEYLKY